MSLLLVSLPGLAALVALLFTWMQVGQTSKELRISEQGQITTRFNAAINNLGSASTDVRLGGIYALERIMHDSTRDHPRVVSVLSAYLRLHASATKSGKSGNDRLPADVDAVMNVLAGRKAERDKGLTINLSHIDLRGWAPAYSPARRGINLVSADLTGSELEQADLSYAQLDHAFLAEADLSGVDLTQARLRDAQVWATNLRGVSFLDADLSGAVFCNGSTPAQCADMGDASFAGADLSQAALSGANLAKATLCPTVGVFLQDARSGKQVGAKCARLRGTDLQRANLEGLNLSRADLADAVLIEARLAKVDLRRANLAGAELSRCDLSGAHLEKADLTGANLAGAHLKGANLDGATLDGARGLPPSLRPASHRG
ncbi:pentapeptide repeat-containing protein [Streptomyces sp. NPDC006335]|uniref:pentapeptide repeat-containing protein n=1 Tax=Streptomyces sp. NPDC006335 TaxID=3156895 RepID=UPI0033A6AE17